MLCYVGILRSKLANPLESRESGAGWRWGGGSWIQGGGGCDCCMVAVVLMIVAEARAVRGHKERNMFTTGLRVGETQNHLEVG